MFKPPSCSDWEYELTTKDPFSEDLNPNETQFHSFKGWFLPDNDVIKTIGLSEVAEIDRIIKEIINLRMKVYGVNSPEVLFATPILEFKHKTNPNLELKCISGTVFNDPDFPSERFNEDTDLLECYSNSLDNYKVVFSARVQKILESGIKFL